MNTKEVRCAKCGKPEHVPAEQAAEAMPYEKAEPKLLAGECVVMHLCGECAKALQAFRKTLGN